MKTPSLKIVAAVLLVAACSGRTQPVFFNEPQSQSVSLGVDVILYGEAYGPLPIRYQWQKHGMDLPGADMEILIFSPLRLADAGDYTLVASDFTGSVTSRVATVTIDPAFTKITTDPVVRGDGSARNGAWGDYNNDGFLDLFVAYDYGLNNALFRNNADGTFTQITNGLVVSQGGSTYGGMWGDANNDGFLDLFAVNYNGENDFFYLNRGDGTFDKVTNGVVGADAASTFSAAWADADNDGWLDLYAVNLFRFIPPTTLIFGTNFLYRNNGDGTFYSFTPAPAGEGGFTSYAGAGWADYDNDGRLDLLLTQIPTGLPGTLNNVLFHNEGSNVFSRITTNAVALASSFSGGGAWGDYNNDGFLDLFLPRGFGSGIPTNTLYRNNGDGSFTPVSDEVVDTETGSFAGAVWGDYDNDGFLDLFVAEMGADLNNVLYHNNGNGTFRKVTTGSLVNDASISIGCSWADYDNDGFLDLFVANEDQGNLLYRNNGNSNAWVEVRCEGRSSNRAGIGAKVRVLATIGGTNRWQLREITGGTTFATQPLLAHFGLGDAAAIQRLRIEWPSGMSQELTNLAPNRVLVIQEPARFAVWPPKPGAALGQDFVFSVSGMTGAPLQFQWQLNGVDILDATNATLVIPAVRTNDLGRYSVAVWDAAVSSLAVTPAIMLKVAVAPLFTLQPAPANRSVSLGVNITYQAKVTGTEPLVLQWRHDGVDIPGATNSVFALTNLQPTQAGNYVLVATNFGGAVTSQVVVIDVDSTFTKVISGSIVNDGGASYGAAWVTFDQERYPSLFIANYGQNNFLYRNLGDGTFARQVATNGGAPVSDGGASVGVAVADFDNDGHEDLFVANFNVQSNFLYRGQGDGSFSKMTAGRIVTDRPSSWGAAWADYDNDGFLDLYVATRSSDLLHHNNGNGTFTLITNAPIATDGGNSRGCAWADADSDGDLDLFVVNASGNNFFYLNRGEGLFTRITTNSLATDSGGGNACAWGDYDNDGDLDLFVARDTGDWLYRNDGGLVFTRITEGSIVSAGGVSGACGWADYDNDGWLDLFVANNGSNFLFRSLGDGTFARILRGSVVSDGGDSRGCAWGDYDDDGFPDLFVSNNGQDNLLYRNSGNTNHWLKVRCRGTLSNASAIGARVRVQAVIDGVPRWQMRHITSGDGLGSQGLLALFGLGDADQAAVVRVEWPSGLVQEYRDVSANQWLVLTEPPRLCAPRMLAEGFEMQITGGVGSVYAIEISSNLVHWAPWTVVTNAVRTTTFSCPLGVGASQSYYRAKER